MNSSGDLTFINDGSPSATAKAAAPAGVTNGFNTLTYTINTSTGAITQLSFAGTDLTTDFSGLTAFTPSVATFAGFYGNSPTSTSQNGSVDNFSVSTVPEPATLGLVAIGGLALLLVKRRRTA